MIYNFRIELLDNLTDFFNGFNRSDFVVGIHYRYKNRFRIERFTQGIYGYSALCINRKVGYAKALLLQKVKRLFNGRMFYA